MVIGDANVQSIIYLSEEMAEPNGYIHLAKDLSVSGQLITNQLNNQFH
jgi:hypothetical protein